MARRESAGDVAETAWEGYRTAESAWRKVDEDGSPEDLLAIQTMCLAGLTALIAQHLDGQR